MSFKKIIYTLVIGCLFSSGLSAQENETKALNSITGAELRDHIFFLASDYLGGRVAVTPEYDIAARYVASQFENAGIEPLFQDEEGNTTFYQEVPFQKTTFGDNIGWTINNGKKSAGFSEGKQFKIMYSPSADEGTFDVVFAGYGIEEPELGWNDFKGLDIKGKFVVVLQGAPTKDDKPVLPEEANAKYNGNNSFMAKLSGIMAKGPAGVMFVFDAPDPSVWNSFPSNFSKVQYLYKGPEEKEEESHGSGSIPSIFFINNEVVNFLFENQKYNPSDVVSKGLKKYKNFELTNTSLTTSFEILDQAPVSSRNVAGIVRGTDPSLADEYIVVGAHLDHVKPVQGQVCNGADDNASGSSGVMEIAEAMAMNPPRRPVIFITYTGEEMGLRGSHFFVNSSVIPLDQLKFNVNMDMIGRSSEENSEKRQHYVVSDKKYIGAIEDFISKINSESVKWPLIFDNDEDSPGGSDHMSFISRDIPAFFFFSGLHKDLHAPGDDAAKIDYEKAESISRLAYLVARRLANMDSVPDFLSN